MYQPRAEGNKKGRVLAASTFARGVFRSVPFVRDISRNVRHFYNCEVDANPTPTSANAERLRCPYSSRIIARPGREPLQQNLGRAARRRSCPRCNTVRKNGFYRQANSDRRVSRPAKMFPATPPPVPLLRRELSRVVKRIVSASTG